MKIGRATGGVSGVGKPGTAKQFQRRELVAVPALRRNSKDGNWWQSPFCGVSSGPPELRGQGGAALEFLLQLAGAEVLAQVFEFLNVKAECAFDVVAIGSQDVAPDLVRSHSEARHVLQAGSGGVEARRPAQLVGN